MDFEEGDIVVLTLKRGVSVISNPKKSRIVEPDDILLCYGKLAYMKGMIPAKVRKRRAQRKLDPLSQEQIDDAHVSDGSNV